MAEIRNKAVHDAVKEWCRQAFAFLDLRVSAGEPMPRRVRLGFEVIKHPDSPDGTRHYTTSETRTEVDAFDAFVNQHYYDDLRKLGSFLTAVDIMRKFPEIARHFDTQVGTRFATHTVRDRWLLMSFLKNIWGITQSLTFSEDAFARVYESLEQFLYADKLMVRILVPLDAFEADATAIELGSGLRIAQLSQDELQELYANSEFFRVLYGRRLTELPQFAIVLEWLEEKLVGKWSSGWEHVEKRVEDVVSVLRVFKPGFFTHQVVQVSSGPNEWGCFSRFSFDTKRHPPSPHYQLAKADEAALSDLWAAYQSVAWITRSRFVLELFA